MLSTAMTDTLGSTDKEIQTIFAADPLLVTVVRVVLSYLDLLEWPWKANDGSDNENDLRT